MSPNTIRCRREGIPVLRPFHCQARGRRTRIIDNMVTGMNSFVVRYIDMAGEGEMRGCGP